VRLTQKLEPHIGRAALRVCLGRGQPTEGNVDRCFVGNALLESSLQREEPQPAVLKADAEVVDVGRSPWRAESKEAPVALSTKIVAQALRDRSAIWGRPALCVQAKSTVRIIRNEILRAVWWDGRDPRTSSSGTEERPKNPNGPTVGA